MSTSFVGNNIGWYITREHQRLSTVIFGALLRFVSRTLTSAVKTAEQLAPRLKALADVHRLTIVLLLADRAMSVKQLHEEMDLGQTLVSHHLAILRRAGLVRAEAQGRSNIYELCCDALTEPVTTIASLADHPPPEPGSAPNSSGGRLGAPHVERG